MTLELFLSVLVLSAAATSSAVELLKTLFDKMNLTYKSVPLAVISAFFIGIAEMLAYYLTHGMRLDIFTILYSVCMGIANSVSATCGYDLTRKFLDGFTGKSD